MASKDPKELEAEIEKAHREILELQQRVREMEGKRERLLKEAKEKSGPTKNNNGKSHR